MGLASRREYVKKYKLERVQRIRELITKNKPKLVICYSALYLEDWKQVTDAPFQELITKKLYMAKDDSTLYAIVPHSVAHGVSNNDWAQIARAIMESVGLE